MRRTARKFRVSLLLVASGWALALLLPAEVAAQSGTFTASGKVAAVLSETKMAPGDKPGHELMLVRRMDVITYSDPVFNSGQAVVATFADFTAGNGPHRGYFAVTHPSGDKTFTTYEGIAKATPKPGGPPDVTFEGKWSYVGGTGKFEGISGGGTYKGGGTPTGPMYEFGGQYTLKQ